MKRYRGYSGLPNFKINLTILLKKADRMGYLAIEGEEDEYVKYIIDKEEKVVALVTYCNGYIKIPEELIDTVINDLKDIKEMYL